MPPSILRARGAGRDPDTIMCGIAGILGPAAGRHAAAVDRMLAALGHRGPDGCGSHISRSAVLGATRLAIRDPAHGAQPHVDPTGRYISVLNGEIYNAGRLAASLASDPHLDRSTTCDTALLAPTLHHYGPDAPSALRAMFAFVIVDEERKTATLARDRFGQKPLYLAQGPEATLLFASEVGALQASGLVDGGLDRSAIAFYLEHGYIPTDATAYAAIVPLPPSSTATVDLAGAIDLHGLDVVTTRPQRRPSASDWSTAEVIEARSEAASQLRATLTESVSQHLASDRGLGALLSGGVDSTTIAALAAAEIDELRTYAFGFQGDQQSEVLQARETAAHLGTRHVEVSATDEEILETTLALPHMYGEPFGDASAVPTHLVCKRAGEDSPVLLGGDGADELFGGYLFWSRSYLADNISTDGPKPGGVARLRRRFKRRSAVGRGGWTDVYAGFRRHLSVEELTSLGLRSSSARHYHHDRYTDGNLADVFAFDADHYLPGSILTKTDRAAMATGVELRSPFLDPLVADLAERLPTAVHVDDTSDKLVLREAFGPMWPAALRNRPKQGFGSPTRAWLTDGPLAEVRRDLFAGSDPAIAEVCDPTAARRLVGRADQGAWNLFVLALWLEQRRGECAPTR